MTSPEEEYRTIPLSKGLFALVSLEDYEEISKFKWYAMHVKGKFYAVRKPPMVNGKQPPTILMHRAILGLEAGNPLQGDHINNAATLDNRRSNLRKATHIENTWNSSKKVYNKNGFKGVSIDKKASHLHPWRARITVGKKEIRLGNFATPELANAAYKEAAKKYFGEFARSE